MEWVSSAQFWGWPTCKHMFCCRFLSWWAGGYAGSALIHLTSDGFSFETRACYEAFSAQSKICSDKWILSFLLLSLPRFTNWDSCCVLRNELWCCKGSSDQTWELHCGAGPWDGNVVLAWEQAAAGDIFPVPWTCAFRVIQLGEEVRIGPCQGMGWKSGCWNWGRSFCIIQENAVLLEILWQRQMLLVAQLDFFHRESVTLNVWSMLIFQCLGRFYSIGLSTGTLIIEAAGVLGN